MASGMKDCPVDAAIVGIVDHVDVTAGSVDAMQIARVIGDVVTTIKDANLSGIKLLVLQPLDPDGNAPAARWSLSMPWARASARPCSSSEERKRASRFIRPKSQPMPASWESSIIGTWSVDGGVAEPADRRPKRD